MFATKTHTKSLILVILLIREEEKKAKDIRKKRRESKLSISEPRLLNRKKSSACTKHSIGQSSFKGTGVNI